MNRRYDAIIVGARCAGASTAMLLARKGHRVLLVDRATFPSDTVSTHVIHAPGIAALRRWGLLDHVLATGSPPIDTYSFDFGPFTIAGTPRPVDGSPTAYAPRRSVLDKILVDAAADAGVEVREQFTVENILFDDDGAVIGIRGHGHGSASVSEHARVVIGADGRNSQVAKAVRPEQYRDKPMLLWGTYTYWRDLPVDGFETFVRPHRGFAAAPTNDDLTMVVVGWPAAEAAAFRADVEGNYRRTLELVPSFAERVRGATRVERFTGGGVTNFFRRPFGPGWVLVGDAGYNRDPITAQGISDAFLDAEQCAAGLEEAFAGRRGFDDAMAAYHHARDERVSAMFEFTTDLARLEPPPPELQQVLGAAHGNQEAMDDFVSVAAGTLSPATFFAPENVGRIMSAPAVPVGTP
jgi:2-polyprenyl-6-methoxyphenol hydroxylase-like FAD-dependent oxidoreductase